MTLPSFICIGSPKCGTTSLSSVLGQLDRICLPSCLGNKEVDYFTLRKGNFIKGLDWYEANFSHCQKDQLAGDFSPGYFSDPDSAKLIHDAIPNVKIVAILRDPARRAFSSYLFDKRACRIAEKSSFKEASKSHLFYLDDSKFDVHLQRYFNIFETSQIHVMFLEELHRDPKDEFAKLLHFLALPEELLVNVDFTPANKGTSNRFRFLYVSLKKIKNIASRIGFGWLSNLLVRNGIQDFFIKWNSVPPEQMPSDLYAELSDYFKEHDRRLCELIQRQELPWQDKTK